MNPLHATTTTRPRDARLLHASAGAILLTVVLTQSLPQPVWAWLVLTLTYVVIETRIPGRVGSGWVAAVAMAATLEPGGVLAAVVLAAVSSEIIRAGRGARSSLVAARAIAHGAAAAALLVVAGAGGHPTWLLVLGGAVAGGIAHSACGFVDRMADGAPPSPFAAGAAAESVALGAGAALVGAILHALGWPIAPVAAAGLVVLASAEAGRRELAEAHRVAVTTLLATIEAKDLYTRGHSERVARYAVRVGAEMRLGSRQLAALRTAALLHDVGKLVVPRQVLRKRGPLTEEERARVARHATIVPDLLDGIDLLAPVVPIVASHHLHYGGGGYGEGGVSGQALPIEARILAVADAYDAITTHRPYRRALSVDYAIGELERCAGSQFDPQVVAAFVRCLRGDGMPAPPDGFTTDEAARRAAEGRVIHA